MPRQIPRPLEPSPSPAQPLVAGIPLERGTRWLQLLWFGGLCFPLLWLMLWLGLFLWHPTAVAVVDALVWSLPTALLFTALYHFLSPFLAPAMRLTLRNHVLRVEERGSPVYEFHLKAPLSATLLYRDHREDALLILQQQPGDVAAYLEDQSPEPLQPGVEDIDPYELLDAEAQGTCFLYGRYPLQAHRPPRAIPVSPLGFSIAEEALDRYGAYMMPDRRSLHLPPLAQAIADAEGFAQAPLQLPLDASRRRLELGHLMLSWYTDDGRKASLSYPLLAVHPFRHHQGNDDSDDTLLLCLERDPIATTPEMDATPGKPFPPFWLQVQWPRPLPLEHLPQAPSERSRDAVAFAPIDAVLLLDHLARRGTIQAPFALLHNQRDTIPDLP